MWTKPGYLAAERSTTATAPPAERGQPLAVFERGRDQELRVALDSYEGRPFISLRVWERNDRNEWWPVKGKGCSVRISEVPGLLEALAGAALDLDDQPPPAGRERPQQPARRPDDSRPAQEAPDAPQGRQRAHWCSPLGRERRFRPEDLPSAPTAPKPDFDEFTEG